MSQNTVIFLPNWVGDVVMATPTLRALRKKLGHDSKLYAVARPYVQDVLSGSNFFDGEILYDPRSRDRTLRSSAVIRQLRALSPDTVVMLTNSLRTGAIAWLSGAQQRVGYARNGRGPLLTHKLFAERDGRKRVPVSAVDYYLQLAYALGCPLEPRRVELELTAEDQQQAASAWSTLNLPQDDRVVVFHTAGGWGGKRSIKAWPAEHFAALAARIVSQSDMEVLVICGPNEREMAADIAHRAGDPRVKSLAALPPSIGLSKACVSRARLMVTTDSGPRHFAAAFGIPTVSLFGPTDPRWAINYNPQETFLVSPIECAPCASKECPLGHHRCMQDMSVDYVLDAVMAKLQVWHTHAA